MLTRKQHELLLFIHKRLSEDGVSPSFDEMKEALQLASKSGVHRLVSALEERGFIRRLAHRARALEVLKLPDASAPRASSADNVVSGNFARREVETDSVDVPLLGKIAAGVPIEAIQHETERFGVPSQMVSSGEHFALEVEGDSMIEAGILDGDYVIIRRGDPPLRRMRWSIMRKPRSSASAARADRLLWRPPTRPMRPAFSDRTAFRCRAAW